LKEFFELLLHPEVDFLRVAVLMGLMSSLAFGMTGSLVVVKRISYVAGAIAHAVLGGIGMALYFREAHGVEWLHPLIGALFSALVAALLIAFIRTSRFEREDSVIGAIWAVGMAAGLVFIAKTPGFTDPMSYLFGNILILSRTDLLLIAGMDFLLLTLLGLTYNHLQAVCFDEELAELRGLRVGVVYTLLLSLVAVTVVLLVSLVGVVLVVALLTIPAAMAAHHVRSLWAMMLVASGITLVFTLIGIMVGFILDWPVGPTIILCAGFAYLAQNLVIRWRG
jgi:zinc transport system permease protein